METLGFGPDASGVNDEVFDYMARISMGNEGCPHFPEDREEQRGDTPQNGK